MCDRRPRALSGKALKKAFLAPRRYGRTKESSWPTRLPVPALVPRVTHDSWTDGQEALAQPRIRRYNGGRGAGVQQESSYEVTIGQKVVKRAAAAGHSSPEEVTRMDRRLSRLKDEVSRLGARVRELEGPGHPGYNEPVVAEGESGGSLRIVTSEEEDTTRNPPTGAPLVVRVIVSSAAPGSSSSSQ
uniref:Uncharacterized protein n=1 Tax=Sphaerodactylus townsendi TaxID=933632 RepID=A0ACB8E9Q8_9SAUR